MECRKEDNKNFCNCTYDCEKKGVCCVCIKFHRLRGELPACYFPKDAEKTYNRSIAYFIELYNKGKIK